MSADRPPLDEACDDCLRRAWLLGALAGHLESARGSLGDVLTLSNSDLLVAVGGAAGPALAAELTALDIGGVRARARADRLSTVCRCSPRYPAGLHDLASPPAALHLAGQAESVLESLSGDVVAIVGARKATDYGRGVARGLAAALARSGVTVVSGMALGIDGAAHAGALDGLDERGARSVAPVSAPTVAVLPASAARAYPASHRRLHRRILAAGAAVSELPPGAPVRRWAFPARNRIIAALASVVVVVEAGERSGSLVTASAARALGRALGAVPGRINSPQARGTNALIAAGARLVRGAQDVLDALPGEGRGRAPVPEPPRLSPRLEQLLGALANGAAPAQAIAEAGLSATEGVGALASLELTGRIRRGSGGGYEVLG